MDLFFQPVTGARLKGPQWAGPAPRKIALPVPRSVQERMDREYPVDELILSEEEGKFVASFRRPARRLFLAALAAKNAKRERRLTAQLTRMQHALRSPRSPR